MPLVRLYYGDTRKSHEEALIGVRKVSLTPTTRAPVLFFQSTRFPCESSLNAYLTGLSPILDCGSWCGNAYLDVLMDVLIWTDVLSFILPSGRLRPFPESHYVIPGIKVGSVSTKVQ